MLTLARVIFSGDQLLAASEPVTMDQHHLVLVEIIIPRDNLADEQVGQSLFESLQCRRLVSLEQTGDSDGLHFLVRAPRDEVEYVMAQFESAYPQISFKSVSPDMDPFRPADMPMVTATAEVKLGREAYYSIRTYKDGEFAIGDPMHALLAPLLGFEPGERAGSQLIITPARDDWARRLQTSTAKTDRRPRSAETDPARGSAGGCLVIVGMVLLASFLFAFLHQDWFLLLVVIAGALVTTLAAIAGAVWLLANQRLSNLDPDILTQKLGSPLFDVRVRLLAVATTRERANARLRMMAKAYRHCNLPSGNSLVTRLADFDPRVLVPPSTSWFKEFIHRMDRLNAVELCTLFHLPVGEQIHMVARRMWKRLPPPQRSLVSTGVLIGHTKHHRELVPIRLALENLLRNIFLIGRTQQGKSTMMSHLAKAAMELGVCLIVVDGHGDLARLVLSLVPSSLESRVVNLDCGDVLRVAGFNLLDVRNGRAGYKIVEDLVAALQLIWSEFWGPRMEAYLKLALYTLLGANEVRVRGGKPQFTILDVAPLLDDEVYRRPIIDEYVKDPDLLRQWAEFEKKPDDKQDEYVNPILTKLNSFAKHAVLKRIVGQSSSTFDLREIVSEAGILTVNTAPGVIGKDAGALVGAMVLNAASDAVREQIAIPDRARRKKVVVVVDEFQTIPGVDYPAVLGELQKMGAAFILATQSQDGVSRIDPNLLGAIKANVATLFVYQTSADDAVSLEGELDESVMSVDITNLPKGHCYVKTVLGDERLPAISLQALPPPKGDDAVVERIARLMYRYTRTAAEVDEERARFEESTRGLADYYRRTALVADSDRAKFKRPRHSHRDHDSRQRPIDETPDITPSSEKGGERTALAAVSTGDNRGEPRDTEDVQTQDDTQRGAEAPMNDPKRRDSTNEGGENAGNLDSAAHSATPNVPELREIRLDELHKRKKKPHASKWI